MSAVNIFLPQTSVVNNLTAGAFARTMRTAALMSEADRDRLRRAMRNWADFTEPTYSIARAMSLDPPAGHSMREARLGTVRAADWLFP